MTNTQPFRNVSPASMPPAPPEALHRLLAFTTTLHELNELTRLLCKTHFSNGSTTPVAPKKWAGLCNTVAKLQGELGRNLVYAEELLLRPAKGLPAGRLDNLLVNKWQRLLELLGGYSVDGRIVTAISETLAGDADAVFALLDLDWQGDMLTFLEELLRALEGLTPALQGATDASTQLRLLTTLAPPDADCSDDVPFDIFADDLTVNDLEVTLAAIASYAVLKV